MQNNTDAVSWKLGKHKSRILKKMSLASHPSFLSFSFFLFERFFKELINAFYDHIENDVGTKLSQIVIWDTKALLFVRKTINVMIMNYAI